MKNKKGKKILAILMAALMVIGIMPMDWAMKSVSAAGPTTYSFDATSLTAAADSEAIVAGTSMSEDNYITTFGDVKKRTSSSGSVASTEIGKNNSGGFTFTVTGTADLSFTTSSTGGKNTSAIGLVDGDGKAVENNEKVTEVAGSADKKVKLTYTGDRKSVV